MKTRNTVSALALGLSLALAIGTPPAFAQMSSGMGSMGPEQTVMVGGAAMYPSRNIVQNAIHSKDHTTLVAAVKAAGLVKTLEGPGPFTVFAPTNGAFDALPAGTVQTLLKPENKAQLTKILTYHVVPGRLDTKTLDAKIAAGGGEAKLKTVEGDWLTVKGSGTRLTVTDDKGNTADITIPNVYQSNGVIMVINKVLMP
ncbi:MAG: fasciclin domain-containing protein [Xanthomonadaceae bacterium]|nr:fasciclin domain-containing protein [Xanthomonadaceae bacterium]MDE2223991.1 fasciclin domain-containing protein [Xanthomonadaceae bacterium]